jgi:hypothetical protein
VHSPSSSRKIRRCCVDPVSSPSTTDIPRCLHRAFTPVSGH